MSAQPPCSTFASRQLSRVLPIAGGRSRLSSWLLALTMAAITIAFQYWSTAATSVILFYLLLTAQSVWFIGTRIGMLLTTMAFAAGALVGHAAANATQSVSLEIWDTLSRLLSVGLLGFVLAGLRRALEVERWRASTDQLTGALNKTAFDEALGGAIGLAEARGEAVVLAYMDLDGFKAVNDRYGHSAGNRVLTCFAEGAAAAVRSTDIFARIGGDEFAMMLTVPSCLEGDRVAEMVHKRLSAMLKATGFDVTVSMGALVMEGRQMAREDALVEQADRLMYRAKAAGKNALHIGHGEILEAALHAAFPIEPPSSNMGGILKWVDRAETAPLRRSA